MSSEGVFVRDDGNRRTPARQPEGFVVVSWWQDRSGDGTKGAYEYEHRRSLNEALESFREYEDGEFERARPVGIFAARNGLPVGGCLEPAYLMRLMAEVRRSG